LAERTTPRSSPRKRKSPPNTLGRKTASTLAQVSRQPKPRKCNTNKRGSGEGMGPQVRSNGIENTNANGSNDLTFVVSQPPEGGNTGTDISLDQIDLSEYLVPNEEG